MNVGLYLGLTLILLTTVMYAIDINLFTSTWIGMVNLLIITGFCIFAALKNKKANGGFISFKEAFTSFVVTFVVGFLLSTIYTIILLNYIDPEAKAILTENIIKTTIAMMEKFGGKTADMNKVIEEMQKTDSFGVAGQLKGFAFSVIIYSIIGLITALVVKRERPQSI